MISGRLVVQQEAEALTKLAHYFPESFPQAVQHLRSIKGKVVCSGVGKSGHVAKKLASTFASTGTPAYFIHPTEAVHGDLGSLSSEDALLVFSNSGETIELLQFVHHSQAAVRIVVTSDAKSSLAFCSDVVLLIPSVQEACHLGLAPTTSSIMMMSLGDALAVVLSSLREFKRDHYHRLHPAGALGHRLLRVAQVMRTPPPLLPHNALPEDIIQTMVHHGIGCVGLVDAQGELIASVTSEHIPYLLGRSDSMPSSVPCTISPEACLSEALAIMSHQDTNILFVRDEKGSIQGVVCQKDGLRVGAYGF